MPGTFTFRPIQANLTHDTDWLGKMDPYCSYRVGAERVKGPVCRNGGKFPKWEDATVNLPAINDASMVVDLLDKDKILHDGTIGSFVIDLLEVQNRGRVSKWYPVYYHKKPAGEILMEAAFTPELVQQPIVQQPVLIKETIIEPVVVEKVITEEVRTVPQPVHKEFHSGPIIHDISQIHHGGHGHGLVPHHADLAQGSIYQQGTTLGHGTVLPGSTLGHTGSTLHSGSHLHQGGLTHTGLNQGLNQGTYNQTIPQTGLNQGFTQGGLNQGLNQGTLNQGFTQGGLNQGLNQGFTQGGLNQGLNQGTLNQGLTQGTLNQGGLNQGLNQNLNQQRF